MLLSMNWLKDYINIDIDKDELVRKLNLMSAEVEGLEKMVEATNLAIGFVETCVMHPDSDHLHVCVVDTGNEKLDIICGAPNVEAGQKVIVALPGANLPGGLKIKKAKIRGIESNGMICSLSELGIDHKYHQEDGIHVLSSDAPLGGDPLAWLSLDDYILNLDLTPNRADLLSHLGVAYELGAVLNESVNVSNPDPEEDQEKNPVCVFTETSDCESYYARVIKDVKVGLSPRWMQSRLIACGIRPINNVVDITNYVMLEYGQPLHAFDYDKLVSGQILVRNAKEGELIVTLDGKKRELDPADVVITDGNVPIALAGVMGGLETEIDDNTTTILLESATFSPYAVRKTSKRLALQSESSNRFERGLDPARTRLAANRAAELFREYCGGRILRGINYFDVNDAGDTVILTTMAKIESVTGKRYTEKELEDVFERLNFRAKITDDDITVYAPSRRQDIKTYQDVIEEIVRINGYNNIPMTLPKTITTGTLTDIQKQRRMLRSFMLDLGFDEVTTYTLTNEHNARMFDDSNKKVIKILNPISEERASLRHSLLPSLISVLKYNKDHKQDEACLFEIGKGYFDEGEEEFLSGIMNGSYRMSKWQHDQANIDFYLAKGIIIAILKKLGLEDIDFHIPDKKLPGFHPGVVANVTSKGKKIGVLGRFHPELEHSEEIGETYAFELNLGRIFGCGNKNIVMKPLSKYPSVSRDLAVIVDKNLPAGDLVETIRKMNMKSVRIVEIFDRYEGEKLGQDKKSIALSLVFQDDGKTLSTTDVDNFVNKIVGELAKKCQATLRE
ncbi:MAG TPA: phenylalanine--tRNA ligase subunit beta [Bacillota bacterium]|nr:phenylalanine--tRNA ligase subunit beta [Bacillota bacterium]HRX91296.1 phenylalanine--tRNA ligase subunit beta [Candidatus Izemoplasmatales bacterium]